MHCTMHIMFYTKLNVKHDKLVTVVKLNSVDNICDSMPWQNFFQVQILDKVPDGNTLIFGCPNSIPTQCTLYLKKRYHPTTNDNFNRCCPIPVIFCINITENMPLKGGLFSHLTCSVYMPYLGKLQELKITKSAVKEHLLENKPSSFHFICP